MKIFDETPCAHGEGALWHPLRQELFWFDMGNQRMLARGLNDGKARIWQFDEVFSAAGWVDENNLIVASETALWRMDLQNGTREKLVDLEANNPVTRSNDGRADPQGGFWIGTMGKNAEVQAGAIYRYYHGELRKLYGNITITNAICFSPDGEYGYFCDTTEGKIMRVPLDEDGWPQGAAEIYLDLSEENFGADGAVIDANGNFWNAQWGASRVMSYDKDRNEIESFKFPTPHTSCPAFGGVDFQTLFVTTSQEGLPSEALGDAGKVFAIQTDYQGQSEFQVKLGE